MEKMILLTLMVILAFLPVYENSKILILYPSASKSHLNTLMPVAEELVSRGHDIQLVMPFKSYKVNPAFKVTYTSLADDFAESREEFIRNLNKYTMIMDIWLQGTVVEEICEKIFTNTEIKNILSSGKQYDVVIINSIMNECAVAVAPLIGNHTIIASAGPVSPWSYNPAPNPIAILPNYMLPFPTEMTFIQRCINLAFILFTKTLMIFDVYPRGNAVVQKYYPGAPSIEEAWENAALYLVNIDNIVMAPRATVPRIINLPAVRCQETKPLPKDFNSFVQSSSKVGFILFSLGSVAESRFLKQEILQAFISAFSKIKQKVIWKYEGDDLKFPPNVKVSKWIPQTDMLGHKDIRLFITHGGLLGLQEAICYGVPVIGIPLFADQLSNMARIQQMGVGEVLDITTITADELVHTINKVLGDNSYRQNVQKYMPILRDQIEPAVKKGADWIEYAIRHNGTNHLRSVGEDMCIFKYYLLDVLAFVFVVFGIVSFTFYKFVKYFYLKLTSKKCAPKKDNKKMK